MTKTQKIFFAVLTAFVVASIGFAIYATEFTTVFAVWVAALVFAIVTFFAWLFGICLKVKADAKSRKVIGQSLRLLGILIAIIILLVGKFGGKGKQEPITEPTSKMEQTTEGTTYPELPIGEEEETTKMSANTTSKVETTKKQTTTHTHNYTVVTSAKTTYEKTTDGHNKVVTAAVKKCSCGATTGGEVSKKFEKHSYSNGKCVCGYEQPTTTHTHNYTVVTSAKTTYEKTTDGHNKVVTAAVKKCSCGATTGGEVSKKFEKHSYSDGKCVCGATKPVEAKIVLNSRLTSAETGYLCVTPEDAVSITLYGMDKDDLKYTYTDGDGRLVTNEGITFTYKYTDPETGAKLYSMRLSDSLRAMSTDIKFYAKGSSTPVILTVEPQYE